MKKLLFLCGFIFLQNILLGEVTQQDFDALLSEMMGSMSLDSALPCKDDATQQKDFVEDKSVKDDPEKHVFYTSYLKKYYPKVFVIREHFFAHMTPQQIAEALADIVYIFSEKPWFYFFDKADGFKVSDYWEYIIDQCSFISGFLKKARVDLKTNRVYLPEPGEALAGYGVNFGSLFGDNPGSKQNKTENLFLHLNKVGYTSVHEFYALSFDYLIKLFNEGVLLKDFTMVYRYYYELDFVVKKLSKSIYEPDYLDAMKTCKELVALLKNKQRKEADYLLDDNARNASPRKP